jgi:hypothetical protein
MVMRGLFFKSVGFAVALASVVACGGSVDTDGAKRKTDAGPDAG